MAAGCAAGAVRIPGLTWRSVDTADDIHAALRVRRLSQALRA